MGLGGGSGAGVSNVGVVVGSGGTISAGGMGSVTIKGTGGATTGIANYGVGLSGKVTSSGGDVQISGSTPTGTDFALNINGSVTTSVNGGNITLLADGMTFASGNIDAGMQSVTVLPQTSGMLINLGGVGVSGSLGLTTAELTSITAGTLNIGNNISGTITISATVALHATNVNLTSGGDVLFNPGSLTTGGGMLTLTPGNGRAVQPVTSGTDVTVSPASLKFGSNSNLAIVINGTSADGQYQQLSEIGDVNLTGVNLVLSGSLAPIAGQRFIVVNNQGNHPVTGTFVGLPEDGVIANFLNSGLSAYVSYVGGDGNDVVLTVISPNAMGTSTVCYGIS